MNIENEKTDLYKKNMNLEGLLTNINSIISHDYPEITELKYPLLIVVGTPRSGTTLMTQWLAELNAFCFPSNFVSRFYRNPYVGFLIQEMLFNKAFSYKNEMQLESAGGNFTSDVGKTSGPLEPHEFWYFWRQHFLFPEIPVEESEFLKNADFKSFIEQLGKVQSFYNRPFFFKGLIMNWYINLFYQKIPNTIFIYVKRNPLDNMQSLLDIRRRYLDNEDLWFSFKPREYDKVDRENKYIQVAGQVLFTNREIEKQLSQIPNQNKIEVDYQMFCNNPIRTYNELRDKIAEFNVFLPNKYPINTDFSKTVSVRDHSKELIDAYDNILKNFF